MAVVDYDKQLRDIKRIDKLFESTVKSIAKKRKIKLTANESYNVNETLGNKGTVELRFAFGNKKILFFSASLLTPSGMDYHDRGQLIYDIETELKKFQKKASKIHKIKWKKVESKTNIYLFEDTTRINLKGHIISHKIFVYIKDNNLGAKKKFIKLGSYGSEFEAEEGHQLHYGMLIDSRRDKNDPSKRIDIIRYFTRRYQPIGKQIIKEFDNTQDARDYFRNLEIVFKTKIY